MSVPKYMFLVIVTTFALHIALKVGAAFSPYLHTLLTSLTMVLMFWLRDAGLHDWRLEAATLVIWWSCYLLVAAVVVAALWRLLPKPTRSN